MEQFICEMCGRSCSSQSGLTAHRKKCAGPGEKAPEDRSAVGRRSKAKGKAGERKIAQMLTEFTGRNFRKVPGSGGWNKQGSVVADYIFTGDVICDDKTFAFSVESKNQPGAFSFPQLATVPEKSAFASWWHQTCADAKSVEKLPILFFKAAQTSTQTVGSIFVALNHDGLIKLDYPGTAPRVILDVFHGPIDMKLEERDPITKKKVEVVRPVTLENPVYIISWNNIVKYVNKDNLFRLGV